MATSFVVKWCQERLEINSCHSCPYCSFFFQLKSCPPVFRFFSFDSPLTMRWTTDLKLNWFCSNWLQSDEADLFPASCCPMYRDFTVSLLSNHWGQSKQCTVVFRHLNEGRRCMRNTNLLPLCSLGASGKGTAAQQILSWIFVEENLIYCSLIARRSTTKLYKIANG